jgi:hypothetical protein
MPTPWDRITDEAYNSWLLETHMTADEYSEASLVDRRTLKTLFEQQQEVWHHKYRAYHIAKKNKSLLGLGLPPLPPGTV